MAFMVQLMASPAACITAINAVQDSGHPGQAAQLARAKTAAVSEVTAHNTYPTLSLLFSGHHDNFGGAIHIVVTVPNDTGSSSTG